MSEEGKDLTVVESSEKEQDFSKIKIRDILKHRFKGRFPKFKKIIPFLLVGIVCFTLGIGAGRAIQGHKIAKGENKKIFSMKDRFDNSKPGRTYKGLPRIFDKQ